MTDTQDIFKGLGNNWAWASVTRSGTTRVHTEKPVINDGTVLYKSDKSARRELFREPVTPEGIDPRIWERTNFKNGPQYATDRLGLVLVSPVAYCTEALPLPDGHVSIGVDVPAPPPVAVDGRDLCVVKGCGQLRGKNSKRCIAHNAPDGGPVPSAAGFAPMAPGFVESTNRARDLDIESARKPLEHAKNRARELLGCCESDNNTPSLTVAVYMAIFGESPN